MLQITPDIAINESELQEVFIRAAGPGGQNVNKVATAVQLRFDAAHSPCLSEEVRQRLFSIARGRINQEGVLVIEARRFRTQRANRQDAAGRLVELIRQAAPEPKSRRKTKPTHASQERRLKTKMQRAGTKHQRRATSEDIDS
jgi:ribosome-associated protein